MKQLLLIIICYAGITFNAHAGSVGTMKIFTGNNGGVVTVQKRTHQNLEEQSRSSNGLITLSDVQRLIMRTNDGSVREPDTEVPAAAEELPEVADETVDRDGLIRTRLSGRVRFQGKSINEGSKTLTLNGAFKSYPVQSSLKLQDIVAQVVNDELVLSGTIVIQGQEYEISLAPESAQTFVKRLVWLIRRS